MAKEAKQFGRGPFDVAIIEGFSRHLSPEEVSQRQPIAGFLTGAQCLARLNQIIGSRDMLDVEMLSRLNLEDAYYLRNKLRDQMDDASYLDKDTVASWLKTIDAIQKRIEGNSTQIEDALIRMRQIHANVMAEAIRVGYERAILELQKRYPEIERGEAYDILNEAMPLAIESLNGNVIE